MIRRRTLLAASAATLAAPAVLRAQTVSKLTFYYPVSVGGPIAAIIDGYCKDFQTETGIAVEAVYTGDYSQALIKALTAIKGGAGPQMSVLWAAEMHSLLDQDILVSLDEIGLDDEARKWMDGFYPVFLKNSHSDGKLWSVPFQRSTAVQYYNKAHFEAAGLDPNNYPTTWKQLGDAAAKLTQRDSTGRATRWGIELASDLGNAQWTFGALAFQAGHVLMNEAGTETYFSDPKAIEAMAYWQSLLTAYRATPPGQTSWGQLTPDFLEGHSSIIQHTTGNLTNIHDKATFPFGIVGLPGKDEPRTVVGGANLYFFKQSNPAERIASLRFARFISTPERAADWSIKTGYIATRPDAYETKALKDYVAKFPEADVARRYLPVATGELSVHENQRVYKALTDNIQACLTGAKTPEQAMHDTQAEADRLLKPFKT